MMNSGIGTWSSIAMLLAGLFMAWVAYRYIRYDKAAFSKENFSKTATTLGLLAIFLIAFIWVLVLFLRN
jgi:uncharacterized membrane-anchored protein